MRNGYRVYDADTHVQPTVESLEPYLGPGLRGRAAELAATAVPLRSSPCGEPLDQPYRRHYRFGHGGGWGSDARRVLGEAAARERASGGTFRSTFMGARFPLRGTDDYDPAARLRDMDEEGADVHLMVPSGASGHDDPAVEMELIQAQHRFLNEFCATAPRRLKSLLVATTRSIGASVEEIRRWAGAPWVAGVQIYFPLDYPLDHPDVAPLWQAAQTHNLAVVHHSFSSGYPGYRDLWQNPFLGRTASHPWAAMRAVGALFGAGILDRYPELRYGILESGFGWLPWWGKRMDDQVIYMGSVSPEMKHTPSEYLRSGRFYAAIVLHEGEGMVDGVTRALGDGVLMFSSDYPHAECRFPDSVDKALAWESLSPQTLQRLLWDNAVRFFGEP